ncbi:MAG TPA: N-acetyltransferase [Pseudidiomarina sp.]|nr:N-acetyltransferase [Pseudidiomarina sp.]
MTLIQTAQLSDIDAIAALEQYHYGADGYPSAFFYQALAQWPQWLLCAKRSDQVQGYLLAAPGSAHTELWLMSLLVSPAARGLGIGKQLVTTFQSICREHSSIQKVHLTVAPTNTSATQLYLNHGFEVHAEYSNYLGPGEDRLLLTWKSH